MSCSNTYRAVKDCTGGCFRELPVTDFRPSQWSVTDDNYVLVFVYCVVVGDDVDI